MRPYVLLSLLLLLLESAACEGGAGDGEDAAEPKLEIEDMMDRAAEERRRGCPFWSHHRCDAGRCLRHEEHRDGEACSRRCVEAAPTCLHRAYLCDGVPDCEDGSDEDPANCVQCGLKAFPCDGVCRRLELACHPAYSHCRPAGVACAAAAQAGACGSAAGANVTCDGVADCPGGRDERGCSAPADCRPGAFFCDGRCVRESRRCDGVRHCEDGSDELGCPAFLNVIAHIKRAEVVTPDCFVCGNGRCVSPKVKCDGVDDCGNGSDERRCFAPICSQGGGPKCVATSCSAGGIPCTKPYRCGRTKWRCDSHPHCDGGADEQEAECRGPPRVFWCLDGTHPGPLPADRWCDGRADCSDGADEFSCPSEPPAVQVYCRDNRTGFAYFEGGQPVDCPPPPRLIRCYDGTTRHEATRCDGAPDCPSGEDEAGCEQCYDGAVLCDGRCVMASRRCDGYLDCKDGADERGCRDHMRFNTTFGHPVVCGLGRFDCSTVPDMTEDRNRCIDAKFVCDGAYDCANRADEANCAACRGGAVLCGGRCVRRVSACAERWGACFNATAEAAVVPAETGICDGTEDCEDGVDEEECQGRQRSRSPCQAAGGLWCDGACKARSARCDAVRDCRDGEDEKDCPENVARRDTSVTTTRRHGRRIYIYNHRSTFTHDGTTYEVTTMFNETDAVIISSESPPPATPAPLACPTTTTPEPTTTPELAPTPAPPLRAERPRKRSGGGGGGGRKRQQQRERQRERARKRRKELGTGNRKNQQQRQWRQRNRKPDIGDRDRGQARDVDA